MAISALSVQIGNRSAAVPLTASITDSMTGTDAVTANMVTGGATEDIMSSDWSNSTGNSDTALKDGTKWSGLLGSAVNTWAAVINAAGAGLSDCPTTNCLQITLHGSQAAQVDKTGLWTSPGVGESRYYRVYMRNDIANDEGTLTDINSHHPVAQTGTSTESQWNFNSRSDGTFEWFFWVLSGAGGANSIHWRPYSGGAVAYLAKFAFNRFEWAYTKVALNSYTFSIRIYDVNGILLYDNTSIRNTGLTETLSAHGNQPLQDSDMNELRLGTNGASTFLGLARDEKIYYAKFGVGSTGWLGA